MDPQPVLNIELSESGATQVAANHGEVWRGHFGGNFVFLRQNITVGKNKIGLKDEGPSGQVLMPRISGRPTQNEQAKQKQRPI